MAIEVNDDWRSASHQSEHAESENDDDNDNDNESFSTPTLRVPILNRTSTRNSDTPRAFMPPFAAPSPPTSPSSAPQATLPPLRVPPRNASEPIAGSLPAHVQNELEQEQEQERDKSPSPSAPQEDPSVTLAARLASDERWARGL